MTREINNNINKYRDLINEKNEEMQKMSMKNFNDDYKKKYEELAKKILKIAIDRDIIKTKFFDKIINIKFQKNIVKNRNNFEKFIVHDIANILKDSDKNYMLKILSNINNFNYGIKDYIGDGCIVVRENNNCIDIEIMEPNIMSKIDLYIDKLKEFKNDHNAELKNYKFECQICWSHPIDTLIYPCRHIYACNNCIIKVKKCSICNSIIKSHEKIFLI
jgi:DNA-binding ferritin-like protein (Dps family)